MKRDKKGISYTNPSRKIFLTGEQAPTGTIYPPAEYTGGLVFSSEKTNLTSFPAVRASARLC